MTDILKLTDTASQVRRDILRMVTQAGCGHPGGSMSSTDFITALYLDVMKHSPEGWSRSGKGQDMFILSTGHMSPLLYSILARTGIWAPDSRAIRPLTSTSPAYTCPPAPSARVSP